MSYEDDFEVGGWGLEVWDLTSRLKMSTISWLVVFFIAGKHGNLK